MIERFGVVVEASKDKGPFMLLRVKSEMRTFTVKVENPYGMNASPEVGSIVTIHPNPDGGMEKATPYDLSANRQDGLKEGEVALGNTKAKTKIHMNKAGEVVVDAKADIILNTSKNVLVGGKGGRAVARIGDRVSGGKIVEGSSKVFAVD